MDGSDYPLGEIRVPVDLVMTIYENGNFTVDAEVQAPTTPDAGYEEAPSEDLEQYGPTSRKTPDRPSFYIVTHTPGGVTTAVFRDDCNVLWEAPLGDPNGVTAIEDCTRFVPPNEGAWQGMFNTLKDEYLRAFGDAPYSPQHDLMKNEEW